MSLYVLQTQLSGLFTVYVCVAYSVCLCVLQLRICVLLTVCVLRLRMCVAYSECLCELQTRMCVTSGVCVCVCVCVFQTRLRVCHQGDEAEEDPGEDGGSVWVHVGRER